MDSMALAAFSHSTSRIGAASFILNPISHRLPSLFTPLGQASGVAVPAAASQTQLGQLRSAGGAPGPRGLLGGDLRAAAVAAPNGGLGGSLPGLPRAALVDLQQSLQSNRREGQGP